MNWNNHHTQISLGLSVLLVIGLFTGCDLVSQAARGDDIDRSDVVRSAEREHSDHEREQEQIANLVDQMEDTLDEIKDLRQDGRFGPADMRVDRLDNQLSNLEDLDSSHDMLDEAPARLDEIKAEFTREDYERQALAEECQQNIDTAREMRMNEQWRRVDTHLTNYVQCRRRLVDLAGDAQMITDADDTYAEEIEAYADYQIGNIESYRQNENFRNSATTERSLANHLEYFDEVIGDEDVIATIEAEVDEIRETYRDPAQVEAEQAEDEFYDWRERAEEIFTDDFNQIREAEDEAKPLYEEARELMDDGEFDEALAKLQEARTTLYQSAYPSAVAMETAVTNRTIERGLSHEIAAAIAEIHFHQGDRAKMYPELSILQNGRTWLDEEDELKAHLHQILADRDGDMVPQTTERVQRYAGEFSDTATQFRRVAERADARSGEAYRMLGVDLDPISERQVLMNPDDAQGEVIRLEEEVTNVAGGNLEFDFRATREVATNCRNTNEVASANVYTGEVRYRQECDSKQIEEGYVLSASAPSGVQVQQGDIVELYATVGSASGDNVTLNTPGVVRVMREGETVWYQGVTFD